MHGFFREGNPDNGPKYGEWELSRDDIVNQIAAQNLAPREAGWITIRMRGEIPQIAGKTYFLVCEKITGGSLGSEHLLLVKETHTKLVNFGYTPNMIWYSGLM